MREAEAREARLRQAEPGRGGEHDADPRDNAEETIGIVEVEEAGRVVEVDPPNIAAHGQEPVLAQQRRKLIERHEEGGQIGEPEPALDDEARQPIVRSGEPIHHISAETPRRRESRRRSGWTAGRSEGKICP